MYGKSRFYNTFTVFEWQMNMKIKQGKKLADQNFLQKNILFGAVLFKTTRNSIFFSRCILQEKVA
jgi:hypothetical protein